MNPRCVSRKSAASLEAAALRIMDANLNRAKEGLRICEDITRFAVRNEALVRSAAGLRHAVGRVFAKGPLGRDRLLAARCVASDPAKKLRLGPSRKRLTDVFFANSQRVKEALRVLEEITKIFDASASARLQKARFQFYDWEQKTARRLTAISHPR
jgi:thiamine-phosphate pyrophosphorylase